jgi:hypothetical protein
MYCVSQKCISDGLIPTRNRVSGVLIKNNVKSRGGASLGAIGAKPHFIFGDKKRRVDFRKANSYIVLIYLKTEGSSNLQISV